MLAQDFSGFKQSAGMQLDVSHPVGRISDLQVGGATGHGASICLLRFFARTFQQLVGPVLWRFDRDLVL